MTDSNEAYPMRINKYLAFTKHSTRRGADALIEKGKVFINGRKAVLGDKVLEGDEVEVRMSGKQPPKQYFAYNKARGIVTHSAEYGSEDIEDVLDLPGVFPIGRLDKDSHGLIILSDDGRITQPLLDPEYDHEKEYVVTTKNDLRNNFKTKMELGVEIEDGRTRPCKVKILNERTFRVILTEGKKHQIRRMCSALFQDVDDLKRVRIMNIELGKLGEGQYRRIEGEELAEFLSSLGL